MNTQRTPARGHQLFELRFRDHIWSLVTQLCSRDGEFVHSSKLVAAADSNATDHVCISASVGDGCFSGQACDSGLIALLDLYKSVADLEGHKLLRSWDVESQSTLQLWSEADHDDLQEGHDVFNLSANLEDGLQWSLRIDLKGAPHGGYLFSELSLLSGTDETFSYSCNGHVFKANCRTKGVSLLLGVVARFVGSVQLDEESLFLLERSGLACAAATNNQGALTQFLHHGLDVDDVCGDDEKITALMMAARGGHVGLVQLLVRAGANVNRRDRNGLSALCYGFNFPEVVAELILQGADVNVDIDWCEGFALAQAIDHNNVESVRLLLDAGAKLPNYWREDAEVNESFAAIEYIDSRNKTIES